MLIENNKIRHLIILFVCLLSVWWLLPNFIQQKKWWLLEEKLNYGLDIQGGLHLVLGVNVDEVMGIRASQARQNMMELLKKSGIQVQKTDVDSSLRIHLHLEKATDINRAQKIIEDEYLATFQVLSLSDGVIQLAYSQLEEETTRKDIVRQSIEVIRNRIDEFGVNEPSITAQGEDRILVQLPGIQEAQKAKDIIQKTAKLELMMVSEKINTEELLKLITQVETQKGYSLSSKNLSYRQYVQKINQDLKGQLPQNTRVGFMKDEASQTLKAGRRPFLLETDTNLTGDMLDDAGVGAGQFGEPVVNFQFGVEGRKRLSEVTSKNIGRSLAVVFDNVVKVAPQIQAALFDRGMITLGSGDRSQMLEEATMIATTLRAGALPTSLEQLEERSVGPTLGKDHIQRGQIAALVAIISVLIFLIFYFKILGVIANIALILNIGFLVSLLTSFGATLTLPGMAGIILTVGMAVDASIIIFERIKEELKKGSSLKLSVNEGFNRAFSAILDANITTAIICLILMYFGTGPIRGFAITLFCGIITSVFTATFVSRTFLNSAIRLFNLKSLGVR